MEYDKVEVKTMKYAWNPAAVGWIGFFFSFLPAGIMQAINFERLGRPELKKPCFVITIVAFIIFIILIYITPKEWQKLFTVVNISICYSYYYTQKGLFEQYLKNGGRKASIGTPLIFILLISCSIFLVVVGGIFGYTYLKMTLDEKKFNYAVEMLKSEKYMEAEPIFIRYKKEYPEDSAAYYNLASIYRNTGRLEMAKYEIKKAIQIDPSDIEYSDFLKEIEQSILEKPQ